MPFGDGTGPWGVGPMTGRGLGYCASAVKSGYAPAGPFPVTAYAYRAPGWPHNYGFGRSRGMGRGRGRGIGAGRGMGRGAGMRWRMYR